MGQRSQIIIRVPPTYLNNKNPNNKPERWYIFHNQWLYGYNFVKYILGILEGVNQLKEHILNRYHYLSRIEQIDFYEDVLEKVISHLNHKDLLNQTNTHRYYDGDNDTEIIQEYLDWDTFLDSLDNNNGYAFIYISDNGEPMYDIVTGYEDSDERRRVSPKEYLQLFYDDEQLEDEEVISILNRFKFRRINYKKLRKPMIKEAFNRGDTWGFMRYYFHY